MSETKSKLKRIQESYQKAAGSMPATEVEETPVPTPTPEPLRKKVLSSQEKLKAISEGFNKPKPTQRQNESWSDWWNRVTTGEKND